MATNKNGIDISLEISKFQEARRDLVDTINLAGRLSTEFQGVSTSTSLLEKQVKKVEEVISILTNEVDSNGKMSIATAKKLQEALVGLSKNSMELERMEGSRLTPQKFREKLKSLTEENEHYKQLKIDLENVNKELEKSQKLQSKTETLDSFLGDNYKKGLSEGAKNLLATKNNALINDVLKQRVGKTAIENRNKKLAEWGISTEEANALDLKNTERVSKQEKANENYNKILEKQKNLLAQKLEIEKQIQALYNQGVAVYKSATDTVDAANELAGGIHVLTEEAEKNKQATIDLNAATAKTPSTFQQATKAIISSRLVLRTLRKVMNEAIRTIREMDKALTGMTAVTGKSREEVLELIPTLKKLAQQTSSTMTDVANLTTEYLRQGRTMEDALELAKETAKAAQIAEISTADSLTYMTSAINGFNLAASDAAHVSDVFANVAAKTATDYEQLAVALSKVSAQANLAGMSMEYTTALLAKGIETTQEAPESIGTALKTIIARMRELTDYNKVLEDGTSINKVERALSSAGISLRGQNGAFRDLEQIFNELGPKWDSLNAMQQQAIAQAVAGTRQQSRFVAIMQDWNRTMESVAIAEDSAGASAYQYSKMAEGLGATITNLTTSWQGFTTSLVDTEFVIDILKGATNFLNSLSEMSGLWKVIGASILAIVGYTKIHNTYLDYQYKKHLEIEALKKQAGETDIINGKQLKKAIIDEQAKLNIMKEENKALKEQLLLRQQAEESNIINNPKLSKKQKNKRLEDVRVRYKNQRSSISNSELKQENLVNSLKAKNESRLATTIKQLSAETKILFTKQNQLKISDLNNLKDSNSLVAKMKILSLDTKKLDISSAENKQLAKNLELQKDQIKGNLKMAAGAVGLAVIIAGIALTIKQISKVTNIQEKALKSIEEHSNNIYELNNKSKDLNDLIDQYQELYNKVVRTKEEEEKLLELEKQLQEQEGVSGTGSQLIASAKAVDVGYKAKIGEERDAMVADTMQAFKKASKDVDFFANSTFENAFKKKYEMQLDTNLEEELSKAVVAGIITMEEYNKRLKYSKETGRQLLQNIDSQAVAEESWAQQKANNITGDEWLQGAMGTAVTGAVGMGAGVLTAMGIGSAIGTSVGLAGTVVGAVVGAVVGITAGIVTAAVQSSQKYADEAAAEQAKIMGEYTKQISNFSTKMSTHIDDNLSKQYEVIKDEIENGNYSDLTLDAIKDLYGTVISIFENPEISRLAKNIESKLGAEGKDFLKNIANALEGLGEDSLKQAFSTVSEALNEGASSMEAASKLYVDIADKNSIYYKEQEANWLRDRDEQIESLKSMLDSKKTMKAYAKQAEVSVEAYEKQLQEQLGKLESSTYEFSEEREKLMSGVFSMITSDSSVLSLQQSLTGLDSAKKNLIEIDKALNDGTLSLEQMATLASTLGEDFYKILNTEGIQGARSLITNELIGPYDDYLKQIDSFILGQQTIIDAQEDQNSAAAQAARQNIELVQAYRKEYMAFNKTSLETYINQKKLAALEKESKNKNSKALKEIIKLKKAEYKVEEDRLKEYFKDYPEELELIKKIRAGVTSVEEAWEAVADKENFKRLLENTESYFEDLEELQSQIVDYYKSSLELEQDALQSSLDERKKMYEKYFDAIDQEDEEEDFSKRQAQLQRAIASLSSATDSNSLTKLKEYQEELSELEKDYFDNQKETQRENMMAALDNQSESMDQYYEKRLSNEKELWDTISSYSEEKIDGIVNSYASALNSALGKANGTVSGNGYSKGGLVDYTGIAYVHGSSSEPEAFLNAQQTKIFAALAAGLEQYYTTPSYTPTHESTSSDGTVIENINITLQGTLTNDNIQETADSLAQALRSSIQRTGISMNRR